jgi:pimeloyl-ACP methyl ester carboxylesterase
MTRAIDLPSHGTDPTDPADVTLDLYANAIVAAIDMPVVLVGHSMAGYPITQAANLAPEKVSKLIYLCAYAPVIGHSTAEMRRMADTQPLRDAIEIAPDRVTFSIDPTKATQKFYHDVNPARAAWAVGRLGPQPILPQETAITRLPDVPRHYIRCTNDRTIPPAFQAKMTADWPANTISEMTTSHSPFLSDPAGLAAQLIAAI